MSHDINSDPEMWELTDKFGDRGLRAWLECLSIADRNDGLVPGERDSIVRAFSIKLNSNQTRMRLVFDWFLNKTWLMSDPLLRVRNYGTYKASWDGKKKLKPPSPNLSSPNHPNLTKPKNHKNDSIKRSRSTATAYPQDFQVTDELREWAESKGYRSPDLLLEAFRDHHTAKGHRFVDWMAAFHNWIRLDTEKYSAPNRQTEGQLSDKTLRILRRGL